MQRKKPRTGMPGIFSNNDDGNFRLLARSTSIRSLSYHLTRNCLGIGGSKAPFSRTFHSQSGERRFSAHNAERISRRPSNAANARTCNIDMGRQRASRSLAEPEQLMDLSASAHRRPSHD